MKVLKIFQFFFAFFDSFFFESCFSVESFYYDSQICLCSIFLFESFYHNMQKKNDTNLKKNDTKTAPFFILKGCGRNILYCLHSNRLSLFLYQIFYLVIMTNCSAANFRFFKCYQLSPYVPAVMPYLLFIAIY